MGRGWASKAGIRWEAGEPLAAPANPPFSLLGVPFLVPPWLLGSVLAGCIRPGSGSHLDRDGLPSHSPAFGWCVWRVRDAALGGVLDGGRVHPRPYSGLGCRTFGGFHETRLGAQCVVGVGSTFYGIGHFYLGYGLPTIHKREVHWSSGSFSCVLDSAPRPYGAVKVQGLPREGGFRGIGPKRKQLVCNEIESYQPRRSTSVEGFGILGSTRYELGSNAFS